MTYKRHEATAQWLLLTLAILTAVPAQAQKTAAIGGGSDHRDTTPHTRILNRQLALPKITLTASRDTVIAGMDELELTVTLEEPADERMQVTVRLAQEQDWLSTTSYQLAFTAGSTIHELGLHESPFSLAVIDSGTLTAMVDSVSGYDTSDATVSVYVIPKEGPVVSISLSYSSYAFLEDGDDTDLILRAQMDSGVRHGITVAARVESRGNSSSRPELTATSGSDYSAFDETLTLREQDYALENGRWVARLRLPVTLFDDDVREGREKFLAVLNHGPGRTDKIRLLNADTSVSSRTRPGRWPQATGTSWGTAACRSSCRQTA